MKSPESVAIIGAGAMAEAHAATLEATGVKYFAVCRSEASAERFRQVTGANAVPGGVDAWLSSACAPEAAIVATPVADLAACAASLIAAGCRRILLEKPGAVTLGQLSTLARQAEESGAVVHIAFNRRFYASVLRARELIAEDGGVSSFNFEFTEVADRVSQLPYPAAVLANWELANSMHVIDTAFHLCGIPRHVHGVVSGALAWHPRCARFAGHGETENGALFTYSADWDAPGRWSIEINTRLRRLILKPMETLQVQHRGSFAISSVPLDDMFDTKYKPGLYRQVSAWLGGMGAEWLLDIGGHERSMTLVWRQILGEDKASTHE